MLIRLLRWKVSTRPPGKPGNTRLTKHFWLGFLSRDLSYQTFMVNYNQAYAPINVMPAGGEAGHRVGI